MTKLHSYVVARDFGFAPNPFYSYCTLCTCKPVIRRTANVGDWVVGTGSAQRNRANNVVFAMKVTEVMNFDSYWADNRFLQKRPNLRGSKKQAFGDNIYRKENGTWLQVDSHHSLGDGSQNDANVDNDTQTDRVLVSDDFVYWGGEGPRIPKPFRTSKNNILAVRGHRNRFDDKFVEAFVTWVRSTNDERFCGSPLDWVRSE